MKIICQDKKMSPEKKKPIQKTNKTQYLKLLKIKLKKKKFSDSDEKAHSNERKISDKITFRPILNQTGKWIQ